MAASRSTPGRPVRVHGTEILASDTRQQYREKLARITLDSMVQFVGLLDAEGTVLEINKVALDAVGIQLSEVEGKPFWTTFWWQVSEEVRGTVRQSIGRAAQGESVRWDTEIYGRAGGSETIVIDASLCPVVDEHGCVVFIAAEGRDITAKKAYEQEIARKNADLQALLERIRELDEIKTQFFANVSHELRTPLSLIIGPAERLLRAEPALAPGEQREAAQVIVRNARMLLKHVNDLLDVAKLEAGKLKIELQDTDVAALVRFMTSHFEILAAERGVTLAVEAPPSLVVAVDAEKLQRVVMNLLSNAFKFVPAAGTVRCRLETANDRLLLGVEDSGPGVKPELRQAIFERFRQGDGGANRQLSGTGLGLAIAREFVEMHKGGIEALDSDLGGAWFQVSLPLRHLSAAGSGERALVSALVSDHALDPGTLNGLIEELRLPASAALARVPDPPDIATRAKVLVVEDNPDMNRFVAQCLSRDYLVISAFDGQQGLEMALAHRPELIVSDIMMPGMSGEQMLAELRRHPEMQETPILLLSAKADEELKVKLLERGAQDFVTKPFTERDLLVRARNLIAVRQSHETLRQAEELKRQAVEAANRELQRAEEALRAADRRKDEFLATLAHELRNPLAPIRHAATIAKMPHATAAQIKWSQEVIDRQVEHMSRLLDDLLEVTRITLGKLELRKERLVLQDGLVAAVEAARPLIEARRHELVVDLPAASIHVDADPVRLAQIFSNLLTNAAKYTDPGGRIHLQARRVDENAVVSVEDDGAGISAELLPKLFEMFTQATSTLDRSEGGLGIGLSLARGLVARHGGRIEAKSRGLGMGSEFIVTLPLALPAEAPAAVAAGSAAREEGGEKPLRVLVADDNRDNADACAMLLAMAGHEVRTAYSGREALAVAAELLPQIALLDIGMPEMDGYEVARQIRAAAWGKSILLVAVTGWGQDEDRRLAAAAGFDHHCVKPVDLDSLRALFAKCAREAAANQPS
jgi:PAS domain S-box-containing protein